MVQVLLDPGGSQPPSNPFSAYDPIYDEVSKETGIPAAILKAQTMQESSFDPSVVSKTGGVGLMQIQPSTAMKPGYGVDPIDPARLTDPADNIRFGARYLAARAKDAGVQNWNDPNEVAKGLTAYNGGGDPNYVQNVFRHLKPPGGAQPQQAAPQAPQPANPWGAPAQQPAQASEPFAVRDISHLGQFNWGKIEKPEGIVIHHTGGRGTPEGIMNVFKQRGLATQYIMDRDGNVHRALPEGAKGRHLKPSEINGLSNSNAIGIEIIAKDDSDLTDAQRASAAKWLAATQSKYNIPAANVFGHGEVNSHKQRTEGSTIVSAWRAANGIEGVPSVNIARAQSIGQPLNPTVTAAAERGRGPAADRPARAAAYVEGQMPMARRQMVDTTSADNAGVLEFLRQQAGMGQETMPVETAQGGLGGLGGFRAPVGSPAPASAPASLASAPASRSVESLIPAAPRDPFAIIGKGAAQNQEWEAQRQGRVALANELVRMGMDPQRAVGLTASPDGIKLALSQINQDKIAAANKEAIGSLLGGGQSSAPVAAPVSQTPAASAQGQPTGGTTAYNPVTDRSIEGLTQTDKARMVAPLRVLMNPHASKELKDVAEAQYKAIIDETKATPATREYLIAKGQGFGGTLMDYKKELAAAGRTTVSVDNRAEGAEAKGRGEGLAKRWNDIAEDGTKANEDALLFQRFGDILSTVKTGKTTETLEKIRQATGLALDPNTDNVQALNSLINYVAPRLRVPGSGAQSDRELANFLAAIPSLAGSPEGNQKILATLSGLIGYRRQRAAVAADWQNGDISAKDAQAKIDAIPSPFSQPAKANGAAPQSTTRPDGSSPPTPSAPVPRVSTKADFDALPSGSRFLDPEGKTRVKP